MEEMKEKIKNGKYDDKVSFGNIFYYRIGDALYAEDGSFVSGLSGNLNDFEDEIAAEPPESLKGLFGL